MNIEPNIKLQFRTQNEDEPFNIGYGIIALCKGVQEYGSLNRAAKELKMAYSKAWRIVKTAEAAAGTQFLDRDGAHGSTLTPDGILLIKMHEELEADVKQYASKRFAELMKQARNS